MAKVKVKQKHSGWALGSYFVFGLGLFKYKKYLAALLYLLLQLLFIAYFIFLGINQVKGLISLGDIEQGIHIDPITNIPYRVEGDNSMLLLLSGVVFIVVLLAFIFMSKSSFNATIEVEKRANKGLSITTLKEDVYAYSDAKIHRTLLAIPLTGLVLFTIIPLIYMILIAFTNFDYNHQPPGKLFNWVGLANFNAIFGRSELGQTFWPILGWTLIWAVVATFSCYFLGMGLAMLINRKGIKSKNFYRTLFVVTIAIPSFVSLLVVKTMLQKTGIINVLLLKWGFIEQPLPFLSEATWARFSVIITNMWIGIPYSMLITSGILMNIPADQYESATLDGANSFQKFIKITFPYMIFMTTPYLISNFIANINNFSAIYFLTEGGPKTLDYFGGAGKTDLLVTWLYKLTVDSFNYNLASAIGIIIFVISAGASLFVYRRSAAYKEEDRFR